MKPAHALLTLAVVAAANLVLAERQHRQRLALRAADMHGAWIDNVASSPELSRLWAATDDGAEEDYATMIQANRLIALLAVKYRVGILRDAALRVNAHALMERPAARLYWSRWGAFRSQEATDRTDRRFNAAMGDAYELHRERGLVAP